MKHLCTFFTVLAESCFSLSNSFYIICTISAVSLASCTSPIYGALHGLGTILPLGKLPSQVQQDTRAAYRPLETACGSCYVQAPETPSERYIWIDEVSDQQLAERLRKLSKSDIELLTLIVRDGCGVNEIAKLYGVAHSTISRKITRIKKFLKNF